MKEDIEKVICPDSNKLIIKDYLISAKIVDEELDIFECSFNNDDCVTIDISNFEYIVLSLDNLNTLQELIYEAQNKFNQ